MVLDSVPRSNIEHNFNNIKEKAYTCKVKIDRQEISKNKKNM